MNVFKLIEDNGLNLHGDIEHFAELIRQEEREACAKVADDFDPEMQMSNYGKVIARRIRARGEQ